MKIKDLLLLSFFFLFFFPIILVLNLFLEGDVYCVVIIEEFELIVFKYSSKILHCWN